MNHKKIIWVLFVFTVLVSFLSFVVAEHTPSFCLKNEIESRDCIVFLNNVSEPIFFAFLPLSFITLTLFFVRREVFLAWAKFASVAFPLLLGVLLYTYNSKDDTSGFNPVVTDDELATFFLPPLFAIISLVIIGIKSWKLRKLKL